MAASGSDRELHHKSWFSEQRERERESTFESPRGIAIGNVTSQIFSNIYLNEFDRYVKHTLRIKKYLRYGDDFVIFVDNREQAVKYRALMKQFLDERLLLTLHARNDVIFPCREGLKFLGCVIYPNNRMLKKRVWKRVLGRTVRNNIASYSGLVRAHCDEEKTRHFDWHVLNILDE